MKRILTMLFIPAVMLTACSQSDRTDTSMQPQNSQTQNRQGTENYAADNTGMNKTEKDFSAEHQSNEQKDVQLSADIRKAILEDKNMSVNSQNVKIITNGENITLRGPVDSEPERSRILEIARAAAGGMSVTDEMELKGKRVATKDGKPID
ncbi:MAG: BON domain-containing protein [Candidatus Obscuribacterales bacterium]|nr:BON domain-containing protein [Candidatus Obscuribacterales bacterium]